MSRRTRIESRTSRRRLPQRQIILHIALRHISPQIWRRVRVPEHFTLEQLHRVIQLVFSWLDYHLYEFQSGSRRFLRPESELEGENAAVVTLASLKLKESARLLYVYDMGDYWEHEVVVEGFMPMPDPNSFDWTPRLFDGQRAGPPEDVGGPPGYERFLTALANPKHPEHAQLCDWAPPHFDAERFDVQAVNHALTLTSAWGAV